MLVLPRQEAILRKALARDLVTRATTVWTAGSAPLLKHRRNLPLVDLAGHVPIVKVAGSVLLSKPLGRV